MKCKLLSFKTRPAICLWRVSGITMFKNRYKIFEEICISVNDLLIGEYYPLSKKKFIIYPKRYQNEK